MKKRQARQRLHMGCGESLRSQLLIPPQDRPRQLQGVPSTVDRPTGRRPEERR